ncbi:hypothetical protein B0T16DRAFT_457104 [Cercophora newfieldiana]|uniref:Uncharacterized protein n=1 Tax=Cercophora newfieldiana TaxID=92897 RepID=A0AA40CUG3_9PEZI|nr:hypothetical protein B0T16DRAFT_457104 [Cercophora newfieldiana]
MFTVGDLNQYKLQAYKDYRVSLLWEPVPGGKGSCISTCAETFARLQGSECNPTGSSEKTIKLAGSLDNICGTYSFRVEEPKSSLPPPPPPPPAAPPKTPRSLSQRTCYNKPQTHRKDVHYIDHAIAPRSFCKDDSYQLKPGSPSIAIPTYIPEVHFGNAIMSYSASWVEGCEVEGEPSQLFLNPVPG